MYKIQRNCFSFKENFTAIPYFILEVNQWFRIQISVLFNNRSPHLEVGKLLSD